VEAVRASIHAAPGAVRRVGPNPILWREVHTRAYGRRPLLVKTAYFLVLALICWYALAPIVQHGERVPFAAAYGMIPVGVLSLLLVAAQAATAITSERDTGALDLLLVTDLTPKEFIFGKLLGVCYNTKEYLLPPLVLAGVYALYGCLATPPAGHKEMAPPMNATAFLCVAGAGAVLLAFAMVLGIHVALRTPNSRLAIINTLSTIFFLSVGTLVCVALILIRRCVRLHPGGDAGAALERVRRGDGPHLRRGRLRRPTRHSALAGRAKFAIKLEPGHGPFSSIGRAAGS
jgi:hypothetical protein